MNHWTPRIVTALAAIIGLHIDGSNYVLAQGEVRVTGIVRDFRVSHPDFGFGSFADTGHFAGAVSAAMVDRPALVPGNGFNVATQWTEQGGHDIAPHMFRDATGSLRLVNPPTLMKDTTLDSWDPALGPYGGANVGPAPAVATGSTMPAVSMPAGPGPNVGDVLLKGVTTVSGDIHCDNLSTKRGAVISIDGDVTFFCEESFVVSQDTTIELLAGATLTIYIAGGADGSIDSSINRYSSVNMNTWDPGRCLIYYLGTGTFHINRNNQVCARITAPTGTVRMYQSDQVYGSITAVDLWLDQGAGFHAEPGGPAADACGAAFNDTAGLAGAPGNGGVTDAASFDEWFRDVLGVNLSSVYSMTLTDNGSGVYEFSDSEFYPIDGILFGNENQAHNENFTLAVTASFVHTACSGQFIEAAGGDGLWIFLDDQLVIDLGGADHLQTQWIDLDRVAGLVDGGRHELRLFYASRNAVLPGLALRTNLELVSQELPFGVSGVAD